MLPSSALFALLSSPIFPSVFGRMFQSNFFRLESATAAATRYQAHFANRPLVRTSPIIWERSDHGVGEQHAHGAARCLEGVDGGAGGFDVQTNKVVG